MARSPTFPFVRAWQRMLHTATRAGLDAGRRTTQASLQAALAPHKPPAGDGDWLPGLAMLPMGLRRYRLFRPPGLRLFERVPLLVMLHGCGQDAKGFAMSTRMHRLAARERFFVLFIEQDRHANMHGCWNWYDTRSGRAQAEAALVMAAIDQVLLLYPADRNRVAIAGLSAGASMAALIAARHPHRFRAVAMHSGVPPGTAHSSASALGAMRGQRRTEALPLAEAGVWPPLLVIHGTRDRVVSSANARAAAQAWAEAGGAQASASRSVRRGQRHPMAVTDYLHRGQLVSRLCEVDTLGHAWSGGAAREPYSDARGPDASRLLWAFASQQFEAPGGGR